MISRTSEATIDIGQNRYEVYEDEHGYYDIFNNHGIDFDTEQDKKDLSLKFESGEIGVFIVVKSKKGECCEQYKTVDYLCGMIA